MRIEGEAIICAVRAHGEHGAVVRALTPADGLQAGYVRGGRSRRLRPVLLAGNLVQVEFRARTDEQLASLTAELVHSRAPLFAEPLPAAAIDWATSLTAAALPDGQPYPPLYEALGGLLDAVEAAPSAKGWAAALVRYELLMLNELGFGLDLGSCAATGSTESLAFVSPRSGRAVSIGGAGEYRDRLLRLPSFLGSGDPAPGWADIIDGLALTGRFLARDLPVVRQSDLFTSRDRLLDRLHRVTR
jgi:DNA repair protein RecO (recombination protein O)